MKSQARVHSVKEPIMVKLAKHAVAIAVVIAAASAPVAAHAEIPSFSYTHLVVTHTVQDDKGSVAEQPR
jgi:hypothetical protein